MKKILLVVVSIVCFSIVQSQAQKISVSGNFGYAKPSGDAFTYGEDEGVSFGLGYMADVLYHPDMMDGKVGLGGVYAGSILMGGSGMDIDAYGLELYGVKGYYRFFNSGVSPYVSLNTGLSMLSTPEISDSEGQVIVEGQKSFAFGLVPEIGLELGGLSLSFAYYVPMKYETWNDEKETAGMMQFSLGYRFGFDL